MEITNLSNSSYYNISFDQFGTPQATTTLTKIWLSFQSQVLNSMLYDQIFFLIIVILTIELTEGQGCSWAQILTNQVDKRTKWIKLLRTLCFVSLPLAIYGVLLLISIKMELNL